MTKRKKWNDEYNYFEVDKNSTWKYEPFTNKPAKEITADLIAELVYRARLHKNVKRGKVEKDFNRMFRTYVYRECVEQKIYDGNAIAYANPEGWRLIIEGDTSAEKGTWGNWKPVDKAIDSFNRKKGIRGTNLFIKKGTIPKRKVIRRLTQQTIWTNLLEAAKSK